MSSQLKKVAVSKLNPTTEVNSDFDWRHQSESFWRERLTLEQYRVLREKGTETPFTGEHLFHSGPGAYHCAACDQLLFAAETKYNSHCGWPSFYEAASDRVEFKEDLSHGLVRTEVLCSRCGSHLGHVFPGGPPPTGKWYCINSLSLRFHQSV